MEDCKCGHPREYHVSYDDGVTVEECFQCDRGCQGYSPDE